MCVRLHVCTYVCEYVHNFKNSVFYSFERESVCVRAHDLCECVYVCFERELMPIVLRVSVCACT